MFSFELHKSFIIFEMLSFIDKELINLLFFIYCIVNYHLLKQSSPCLSKSYEAY